MSKELMLKEQDNPIAKVEQMQRLCGKLMQSKHYQKMGEEGVFAIVQKSHSLNIDPIDALNGGLYFVNGKVGMSTEMMASLIRQAGHNISKDPKSTDEMIILHGKRCDNGDTWTCTFGIEHARKAGLLKNMYEKYLGVMLYNRCMSMLARQLFPDVIKGCGYDKAELHEIAENTPKPSIWNESNTVALIEAVEIKQEEETIMPSQAQELKLILSQCDPEYSKKVLKTLLDMPKPVESIESLPMNLYGRIMTAARANKESYQKKLEFQNAIEGAELANVAE